MLDPSGVTVPPLFMAINFEPSRKPRVTRLLANS